MSAQHIGTGQEVWSEWLSDRFAEKHTDEDLAKLGGIANAVFNQDVELNQEHLFEFLK